MPDSAPISTSAGKGRFGVERDSATKATRRRGLIVALPLTAIALVAVGLFVFNRQAGDYDVEQSLDADLCPAETQDITGSATYLLDLRKSIGDATAPGKSLNDIGRRLPAGTELRVYAITEDAAAPRRPLDRFCKPYSEQDVVIRAAKDQGKGERDCNELPAQVSQRVRDLATRFCSRRDALRTRIDQLAAKAPRVVDNAYVVEALEATAAEFASRSKPWNLFVFSDMLQHSDWYSHLDLGWTGWSFAMFAARAAERETSAIAASGPLAGVAPPQGERLRVTVFYPPRRRVTESLRPRYAHQTFWRRYFEAQQADVDFVELSRAPVIEAPSLMVTPKEQLAREIAAVLEDTKERREAAARSELALAELERVNARLPTPPATGPAPVVGAVKTSARPAEPPPEPAAATGAASGEPAPAERTETSAEAAPLDTPPAESSEEPAAPAPLLADALASDSTVAGALPACAISLNPEFAPSLAAGGYPGGRRVNYGAAVVRVRYTVDEQGRTVDAAVVPEVATDGAAPGDLANLAEDTAAEVRRWEFAVPDNRDACALVPQVATFTYGERCRGSPVPTCRTIRTNVVVF